MVSAVNYVAVVFDKSRDDKLTTDSGLELYVPTMAVDSMDTSTETDMDSIRTWGVVAAVPYKNSKRMGVPVVKRVGRKQVERTAADIVPEVQVGDTIHFRYLAMETAENRVMTDMGTFVLVSYPDIFGLEKADGSIHPIGSYVFIEPIQENIVSSDILIIPDDINKRESDRGRVLYIGTPFVDEDPIPVSEGDTVIYDTKLAERHRLRDGRWVKIIYQSDIHMVI